MTGFQSQLEKVVTDPVTGRLIYLRNNNVQDEGNEAQMLYRRIWDAVRELDRRLMRLESAVYSSKDGSKADVSAKAPKAKAPSTRIVTKTVTFHDPLKVKKMSSDRIQKYVQALESVPEADRNDLWKASLEIAQSVLTTRIRPVAAASLRSEDEHSESATGLAS